MNRFNKLSIKAILIGFTVDFVGSIVVGLIVMIILGIILVVRGLPIKELEVALFSEPRVSIIGLVVGFPFTFLGGYIAARIAKKEELFNSCCVGVIGVILGFTMIQFHEYPLWFNTICFLLTIPIAMLGGYVGKNKNAKALV